MTKNKGFTLIELMVVILIVAILAAVIAPMLSGRIQEAKWSEGKTGAGTIATAIRAYMAEHEGPPANIDGAVGTDAFEPIGILDIDLNGKYFNVDCYATSGCAYDPNTSTLTYTITVTPADGAKPGAPTGTYTLDQTGTFTKG